VLALRLVARDPRGHRVLLGAGPRSGEVPAEAGQVGGDGDLVAAADGVVAAARGRQGDGGREGGRGQRAIRGRAHGCVVLPLLGAWRGGACAGAPSAAAPATGPDVGAVERAPTKNLTTGDKCAEPGAPPGGQARPAAALRSAIRASTARSPSS